MNTDDPFEAPPRHEEITAYMLANPGMTYERATTEFNEQHPATPATIETFERGQEPSWFAAAREYMLRTGCSFEYAKLIVTTTRR